ncbi:MAG: alpha/beta hydrolase [Acidobacteriota bacterium]|nr:alpha/beta hydrolase [Acidobacteriota bacterium]MDH3522110.1 alpha/beta hydrolase [Acidobacteriota bacterium]
MRGRHRIWTLILGSLVATGAAANEVSLTPCPDQFGVTARCGWAEVAENRAAPEGRRIRVRVVVLPSAAAASAEPLVMFPGGPGQATPTLIPLATQAYPRVLEKRDVVLIGQRGSGESNAMHCLTDLASDPERVFGALWPREAIRECHERVLEHADPSEYTTADYVADVAEVLDALGYGKVVLWGGSGGTRTAQAFVREHPERVVAAVLDGVTPIDYRMPLPFSGYAQRAWRRVVADCEAQPGCAAAYPELEADLKRVFDRVEAGPVPTTIARADGAAATVEVRAGDLAYALRGVLYGARTIPRLPAEVHHAAATGDLSYFAQALYDRASALLGGVVAVGLHLSSYCAEDVPRLAGVDVAAETAETFLGGYLVAEYRGACDNWPVTPAAPDWYRDFSSPIPTLLVSGYYDPSTPAEAAEAVRRSFPNSRHVVVRDQSHGAGFTCLRPVVEEFLLSASLTDVADPCSGEPLVFAVDEPSAQE